MTKCSHGKLARPVRERGSIRRCKLAPTTSAGRKADRKRRSQQYHELRHRRESRGKR